MSSASPIPSSCRSLRRTLSATGSPGSGCPQQVFVHTPGQVCLDSARLVSKSWPDSLNRYAEKARCSGVWA
jgi:hypothetical protein